MFRHNLVSILRSFGKSKGTFVINLVGLSCSLAVAILIYLWASDELQYDKFYANYDRIYQVMENQVVSGTVNTSSNTPDFLAETLASEMPEIAWAAAATPPNFFPAFTLSDGGHHVKATGKFADPAFLAIFDISFLQGSSQGALKEKADVIISESLAKKIFDDSRSCLGKNLEWNVMGTTRRVTVTGVFKDLPANASERFDFLATFDSFRELMGMQKGTTNWDNPAPFATYLKVREKSSVHNLDRKIQGLLAAKTSNASNRSFFITRYADKHLYGSFENGKQVRGRISYVILFSCIASFLVLIACINFTNLATAKALVRSKASGIRKAIGAQRINLMSLYFLEAMVITFASIIVALAMAKLLLPQFNLITGKHLELVFDQQLIFGLVAIFLLTSLMAGGYPAFYLSGFNPAKVLKGQFNVSKSGLYARKGLVVFQFVMSMTFIVAVIIIHKQIHFISTKDLGYNKEQVVYFEADGVVAQKVELFLSEVRNIGGVVSASGMLGGVLSAGDVTGNGDGASWEGKKVLWTNMAVNYELLELLDIEIKEGRTFSSAHQSDADKIILNEAAVDALGIPDPVGKIIGGKEILGVVKNFHFQSLHETVKPLCFRLEPQATTTILIRYRPEEASATIQRIEKFYAAFNPGFAFTYKYLESDFQEQYESENRVGVLSGYAAGLTIVISCLGLFGLVTYTTETRSKEVAIRKILGSGELDIVLLLSGDFMKTVFVAVVIGIPLSFYVSRQWLDSFAFKIDLKSWHFGAAAVLTVVIALSTVSLQAWKAAKANPKTNLVSE